MSREFAQNVAKAAEEYKQKVAAQKSATALRKNLRGEEERSSRMLPADSESRSL
jgi:hypothetical protein